ncbi:MAG: glutamine synthetase [Chloroflexota bacterium]|nr:glutamine synthetase [Chloroflexota bacterium]
MELDLRTQALAKAREAGVEFVHLQFIDIVGGIKSVTIPAARFADCLTFGAWFDGSAIEGRARVVEGDLYLHPDPATFAVLPWEPVPTGRVICNLMDPDGLQFPTDPRYALQAVLAEAEDLGLRYRVACELEFFLFEDHGDETANGRLDPIDHHSYFELPSGRAAQICQATTSALTEAGLDVESMHHEVGPSQFEIDLAEVDALRAADSIVTLKWALRAFARRQELLASFMPKPRADAPGSGLHFHQVLLDLRTGENVLFDPVGQHQLSSVARHFVAGQLAHGRGMCALLAPLVNSYKRLSGGDEAPARIIWARTNRSALIRVPEVNQRTVMRIELRAGDPSCNPYLALAAMLKAGLDGIRNEIPLPEPVEDSLFGGDGVQDELADPLPSELGAALEELDWDPVVRSAIGQAIYERFLAAKEREWASFRSHISTWELQSYLDSA